MALPRYHLTERQVLMALMGVTVCAVLGAFLWSILYTGKIKANASGNARVRWMRTPEETERLDSLSLAAEYFDPSLMSLPSPHGFSHATWDHLAPPAEGNYEPERIPFFLPPPSGMTIPELLQQPPLNDLVQGGLALPYSPVDSMEDEAAREAVVPVTNSVVQIAGGLDSRQIVRRPNLPLAPLGVSTRGTRVKLAVAPDGQVRYAVLDRSSGNEALDTQAVALAQKLEFNMQASADPLALTWGTASFLWATAAGP